MELADKLMIIVLFLAAFVFIITGLGAIQRKEDKKKLDSILSFISKHPDVIHDHQDNHLKISINNQDLFIDTDDCSNFTLTTN